MNIPESFKPGMPIYVILHTLGVVKMYIYQGDGIFADYQNGKVNMSDINWSNFPYSFSAEQAQCKLYLYKLNQLQEQFGIETRKALNTQLKIDTLNEHNSHLKEKYPEEFI